MGKHEGIFEHLVYARMMVSIAQRSGEGGKGTVSTCYAVGEELELLGEVDTHP